MTFIPSSYVERYRGKRGYEYKLHCPKCLHTNLWWNVTLQAGRCFSCPGQPGLNAWKMRMMFKGLESSKIDELLAGLIKPTRTEKKEPIKFPYQEHWQAKWHLEQYRNLDSEQINRLGFWYNDEEDRICCPVQPVGTSEGVEGPHMSRHTDPAIKGWKAQPFGINKEHHWFCPLPVETRRFLIVEGIFDLATPRMEGQGAATLGTKLTASMQDWFWENSDYDVVIWYDPDESGVKGADTVRQQLYGIVSSVRVIEKLPEPGDLGEQKVKEVLDARVCL